MDLEEKANAFAGKLVRGLLPLNRLMVEAVLFAVVMDPDWDHATKMMVATCCHAIITVKRDSGPHTNFRSATAPRGKKGDTELLLSRYLAGRETFLPFLQCRLMTALNVLLNGNTKLKKTKSLACGWKQPRADAPIVPMPESMNIFVNVCSNVVIEFLDGPTSGNWCAVTRVFTILKEQSDQSEASREALLIAVYVMSVHQKLNKQVRQRLTTLLETSETPMYLNPPPLDPEEFAGVENLVRLRLQPAQAPVQAPVQAGSPGESVFETELINPNDWVLPTESFCPPETAEMFGFLPNDWVPPTEIFFPQANHSARSPSPARGESQPRPRSRSRDPHSPVEGLLPFLPPPGTLARSESIRKVMELCQRVADRENTR